MDLDEAAHGIQTEDQFWDALDDTISQECATHSDIDDALRSFLGLVAGSKDQFDDDDQVLPQCAYRLACSPLFEQHANYIRRQFIYSLLQEDEPDILLITASFLLADAQNAEQTHEILNKEGAFSRLTELIASPDLRDELALHRLLMQLLYEMSRIQKISNDDLTRVTDEFVQCLFDLIEQVSGNVNDPYHYPVIRVLLVLNEQFMVAAHDPQQNEKPTPLTNKVVKVLSGLGSRYKTFGENIILLLNREDETSLQLLTLKLLYLLFTTPQTYEYFYTNDLRVLVDILIRNLLDLPEEASSLRHTYLRVLYPLLEHTQLQHPPHYKREEILKLLTVLGGGQVVNDDDRPDSVHDWSHFEAIDETTKRLVKRCTGVSWLTDPDPGPEQTGSPVDDDASGPPSPVSPSKPYPPALPAPRKLKKRDSSKGSTLTIGQFLAPQLESARQSSLSMVEMATQREKPGVITPSRNPSTKYGMRAALTNQHTREHTEEGDKPAKPPIPKARRSGWARAKAEKVVAESEAAEQAANVTSPTAESPDNAAEEAKEDQEHVADGGSSAGPAPPPLPTATKPQKKPPPAPKARRWQFKRAKEASTDTPREPGKFDSKMPSIKTGEIPPEQSPFSPVEEKTLSPRDRAPGEDDQAPKTTISDALKEAQAQAVQGIDETLEKTRLADTPVTPPQVPDAPDHPQIQITPPPRAVLAPPNQAPPRSVPGPQVEMERSPFLSEAEMDKRESSESEDEWNK